MNKRETGAKYESLAAEYLIGRGYEITEHNYRCKAGEIDLIARDSGYLVFIEVKYRKNLAMGSPLAAVDVRKQKKIRQAAAAYLFCRGIPQDIPVRFDVVGITGEEMILIKDAF